MDEAVTEPAPQAAAPRAARPRSVKRSLASIVLGFEMIVVFLGAMVIFGLAMAAVMGLLRFEWAYTVGWVLQAIVVASGFLNPVMFFVGALFAGMWAYCMINGTRIDHQKEIA
jgi:hypothetical protein